MDSFVFATVLFAAACHAGWNAVIKVGLEPIATTTLIAVGAGLAALLLLPFVGWPAAPSWPWLGASVVIHLVYFAMLAESYRAGDMGQVYPIARGAAPLMTAAASPFFIGEMLGTGGWAGVILLACGVFLLSARGGRELTTPNRRAVLFALATAVTICAYSIVDGIGARLSGNAAGYSAVLFIGNAVALIPYAVMRRGGGVLGEMSHAWHRGAIGGTLQLFSYSIAIWAMTVAPIAIIAALRETSVLFGALIAVMILREPMRPARIVAALLIVGGLVLIRTQ